MAVNLRGPMLGTRTVLPQMLEERPTSARLAYHARRSPADGTD